MIIDTFLIEISANVAIVAFYEISSFINIGLAIKVFFKLVREAFFKLVREAFYRSILLLYSLIKSIELSRSLILYYILYSDLYLT